MADQEDSFFDEESPAEADWEEEEEDTFRSSSDNWFDDDQEKGGSFGASPRDEGSATSSKSNGENSGFGGDEEFSRGSRSQASSRGYSSRASTSYSSSRRSNGKPETSQNGSQSAHSSVSKSHSSSRRSGSRNSQNSFGSRSQGQSSQNQNSSFQSPFGSPHSRGSKSSRTRSRNSQSNGIEEHVSERSFGFESGEEILEEEVSVEEMVDEELSVEEILEEEIFDEKDLDDAQSSDESTFHPGTPLQESRTFDRSAKTFDDSFDYPKKANQSQDIGKEQQTTRSSEQTSVEEILEEEIFDEKDLDDAQSSEESTFHPGTTLQASRTFDRTAKTFDDSFDYPKKANQSQDIGKEQQTTRSAEQASTIPTGTDENNEDSTFVAESVLKSHQSKTSDANSTIATATLKSTDALHRTSMSSMDDDILQSMDSSLRSNKSDDSPHSQRKDSKDDLEPRGNFNQTAPSKRTGLPGESAGKQDTKSQAIPMQMESVVTQQRCRSIAILGTMSDAGKSIITAGICRVLTNHGMRVAPFKGQNMSNNASPALLPEGGRRRQLYRAFKKAVGGEFPKSKKKKDDGYGEIGTAQSLQAEACRLVPRVEMNPVLLKSGGQNEKGEWLCSVLVLGKQVACETYGDLGKRSTDLRTMVLESHQALAEVTDCEAIVMEGAGSCTELNLMERDIVNLPLVRALQCPWLLVANIDCGGVFAQIVGTKMCVSKRDWSLCAGIIVNKLRGEAKYFEPGPKIIENMVGKPVFVVPFLRKLNLPEEDGMGIERRLAWEAHGHYPNNQKNSEKAVVVVVAYPNTAISDDICPLEADPRFEVQWRRKRIPKPYPHTTAVIMPGSRLTQKDLKWLHDSGWATFLRKHVSAGGNILGICGGYQMLGWSVEDPLGVEGITGAKKGIGLLPIRTKIEPPEVKVVVPRKGTLFKSEISIEGFELHCGQSEIVTELGDGLGRQVHSLVTFDDGQQEGLDAGRAKGTYVHGILWSAEARVALLIPEKKKFPLLKEAKVQDPLDRLAAHLEKCGLDFNTLQKLLGPSNEI